MKPNELKSAHYKKLIQIIINNIKMKKNLRSILGWGPIAFDPSQKQSIGVIHIHGNIFSIMLR